VHANIQKDRTFSVVPRIYGGVTSAAELRRIADVAEKYQVPMVKITGGQRIDLLGIRKEDLPAVWRDLGMPSGHAYTKAFRTCKTCVGSEFCRYGVGDSTALGTRIEKRFQGIGSPPKMNLEASVNALKQANEVVLANDNVRLVLEHALRFGGLDTTTNRGWLWPHRMADDGVLVLTTNI